ncbi:MAG: hypothetical protein IJ087_18725 [Eggerthellaceae bacterium]|nr:hypothetical protein [Eggerthellaceae bacterium]
MAGIADAFAEARANRKKRSPLQVGLSTGALIVAIVICVLLMKQFQPDQMLILLFPVLIIGIMFTVHTVRNNSRNKADVTDEHETCMPILDRYNEKHDVKRLMHDYDEWWEGEHSNYTRMHFAAKVIDILQDKKKYERALEVLYQVAGLPLKGRDHYDFDNYLRKVEPILKEGLAKQRKSQHRQLAEI